LFRPQGSYIYSIFPLCSGRELGHLGIKGRIKPVHFEHGGLEVINDGRTGDAAKVPVAFSQQRINVSVSCRHTASLYPARELPSTARNYCGRRRFPSASIHAPWPKSTWHFLAGCALQTTMRQLHLLHERADAALHRLIAAGETVHADQILMNTLRGQACRDGDGDRRQMLAAEADPPADPVVEMAGFASAIDPDPRVEMAGFTSGTTSDPAVEMAGFCRVDMHRDRLPVDVQLPDDPSLGPAADVEGYDGLSEAQFDSVHRASCNLKAHAA
jgi:hypothetical protein